MTDRPYTKTSIVKPKKVLMSPKRPVSYNIIAYFSEKHDEDYSRD